MLPKLSLTELMGILLHARAFVSVKAGSGTLQPHWIFQV